LFRKGEHNNKGIKNIPPEHCVKEGGIRINKAGRN